MASLRRCRRVSRGVLRREMQRLIGYFQPSGSLNYVAECQSPADSVLREGYDVLVPGAHLHRLSPDTQVRAAKSLLCPLARLRPLFSCRRLSYMTRAVRRTAARLSRASALSLTRPRKRPRKPDSGLRQMTDHCCGRGVNLPQSAEIEPAPSTAEGLEAKVAELQEAKVHSLGFLLASIQESPFALHGSLHSSRN